MRALYMDGFIQQSWVYVDGSGSSMIVEAPSATVAADRLDTLPMVRGGYRTAPTIVAPAPPGASVHAADAVTTCDSPCPTLRRTAPPIRKTLLRDLLRA